MTDFADIMLTPEQARLVAKIIVEADGGYCTNCVRGLIIEAENVFPGINWTQLCHETNPGLELIREEEPKPNERRAEL